MSARDLEEPVGDLLGTGTWRDRLPKLPRPVLAVGNRQLYSVVLHGSGFVLPIVGSEAVIGFFATAVVAATTIREAEQLARDAILRQWTKRKFLPGEVLPTLEVDEVRRLPQRFRLRSRHGFAFFSHDDEEVGPA